MVVGIAASLLKGVRLRRGGAARCSCSRCCGGRGRPSIAARRSSRRASRRRGSPALIGAVGASVWLGSLRLQARRVLAASCGGSSSCSGEASRFLRASVGAAVVLLLFAFARLIGHAPHEARAADRRRSARRRDERSPRRPSTFPNLVFLRRQGAAVRRRAHGVRHVRRAGTDVGGAGRSGRARRPADATLIRLFLERCDDFGGVPVFYEVTRRTCITTPTSA